MHLLQDYFQPLFVMSFWDFVILAVFETGVMGSGWWLILRSDRLCGFAWRRSAVKFAWSFVGGVMTAAALYFVLAIYAGFDMTLLKSVTWLLSWLVILVPVFATFIGFSVTAWSNDRNQVTKRFVDDGVRPRNREPSYRRRFIRTLWQTPIIAAIVVAMFVLDLPPLIRDLQTPGQIIILVLFFVVGPIQAVYLYRRWQQEEATEGG